MKHVRIDPVVLGITRKPITLPETDGDGQFVIDNGGNVVQFQATIVDLLKVMVTGYPRDKLTRLANINGDRLYGQCQDNVEDGVLSLEDNEYDWAIKTLEEHGTAIFGMQGYRVERALRDAVKELD